MKDYLQKHEWKIIEKDFHPEYQRISESIFSIGNGRFGGRGNFEEDYSGDTLPGSYIGGIYYPDKTRVGWWKNGYPEYFAKVLNACNWIGVNLQINRQQLDLATVSIRDFSRTLDMQKGLLERSFIATFQDGAKVQCSTTRFCSMADDELAAVQYTYTAMDRDIEIRFECFLDADVRNEDANYNDMFWKAVGTRINEKNALVQTRTRKTGFDVCHGMSLHFSIDGKPFIPDLSNTERLLFVSRAGSVLLKKGQTLIIEKLVAITSDLEHEKESLLDQTERALSRAESLGFENMKLDQAEAWAGYWESADIRIKGDLNAQQAIRFNIFQLFQTYTGKDPRLNIGPKGFTGEKYGGSTYWDTEAYCLPFYLSAAPQEVARNLLLYRYSHLEKAIENGQKLGFTKGAALYPMVTMNGEECHNEWEITFEEIHRNGAIAYAIFDYVRYTGDRKYLITHGLEVLIAIARFWSQRVNWSNHLEKYVILGVTGPNEYENNVHNNWYTNYIATWCLEYTLEVIGYITTEAPEQWEKLMDRVDFTEEIETNRWREIIHNMYYPEDSLRSIFLQQDGFLDKVLQTADSIPTDQRPIHQHWSWDRILRSCFIKQADVLQGLYFFEHRFNKDTIRRNFEFYEPLTVHESSLSPCIHAILAASLEKHDKSYEMYLRNARLDLNDYNNDTEDGCHITSMAGTWMAIVKGFAGFRVNDGHFLLAPHLPKHWEKLSFHLRFRGALLEISIDQDSCKIKHLGGPAVNVVFFETSTTIEPNYSKQWKLEPAT